MKLNVPVLLSANAGYVDTAGFLALQGLFTAHVTGNFVTIGAALVHGSSGVIAKLLALPVFCVAVAATRLAGVALERGGHAALRWLLAAKLALLVVGAAMAVALGPFRDSDAAPAMATGMVLVVAMAIQNAASRLNFATAPPTTLMTGSTTQIMIDLADLWRGGPGVDAAAVRARLGRLLASVTGFAVGCAAGAFAYDLGGTWCFLVPPVLAAIVLASVEVPPAVR